MKNYSTLCLLFVFFAGNAQMLLPKKISNEIIIKHTYYTISYNTDHLQPNWVYHILTPNRNLVLERKGSFKPDPKLLIQQSAVDDDYKAKLGDTDFDIGHMTPAEDNSFEALAMKECFYYSNASPQTHAFNAGDWKRLEVYCRDNFKDIDTIHIFSAGFIHTGLPKLNGRVSVPNNFFKVIVTGNATKGYKGIAFLLAHQNTKKKLKEFAMSIDALEAIVKKDFCAGLPNNVENAMEKELDLVFWKLNN